MSTQPLEELLLTDLPAMSKDPLKWVQYSFTWGRGELAEFAGPDEWQTDILKQIRDGLLTPSDAIQIAVASGHGIGKSCLVAWLILWALSTFEDTRGVVTANTENQLKTKTWSELAKWHRLFIAKHWFTFTATSIFANDKGHEKTWRIDMVPWSERNTEAFAGLHNQGKRILVIMDEASAIPDPIWEVTEGTLTDKDTEILWFAFGNPTRNIGRFHSCFHKLKHRWITKQVDSRSVKITDKAQIDKWIDDYGVESDFVKVRVKGEFPNTSDRQFIPADYVASARGRHANEATYSFAPVIIGVDPAYSGDDECVVYMRQGVYAKQLAVFRKLQDDFALAGYVAKFQDEYKADAVFVDLGYGTGVVSAGKQMGRDWVLIAFGSQSTDVGFLNKRAQMWNEMKQWLKDGGCVPDDPVLCEQLCGPEYIVKLNGKIQLESKEDMKRRGLTSPDRADALALTFALPVKKKIFGQPLEFAKRDYDLFASNKLK